MKPYQRERLLIYFMVFLLGSLCNKLNVFESNKKNRKNYIISNIVLTVSLGVFTATALNFFFNMIDPGRAYFFISASIDRILYYTSVLLSMLSFLYIFIHVFRLNFNKSNRIMNELNKNSYFVYIIHVVVLGLIALALLNLPVSVFFKYLILTILVSAALLTIAIYVAQANPSQEKVPLATLQTDRDVNFQNNEGSTSLHTATFFCWPEIVFNGARMPRI